MDQSIKYKSVLIISDNVVLVERFKILIHDMPGLNENMFYYKSTFLSHVEDQENTNNEFLDLEDEKDIDFILNNYDLVISLHCKQLFPMRLIGGVKCINIHPGYNPVNRGWYPQVFSILYNLTVGATIHEMDNQIDNGPIIDRETVMKCPDDTSGSLYKRIVDKEFELIRKNITSIIENAYTTVAPENQGNLFFKKDFNALKEIDLNRKGTFREFIDYLRAMTFDGYNNSYYNTVDGEKIFVSLNLNKEKN